MPVEVVRAAIRCCYTVARHLGITDGEADAVVAEALAGTASSATATTRRIA